MKMLDEVIELLEQSQADDQMISIFEDDLADAIHYLKNYRDTKAWLDLEKQNYAEAVKNCERSEAKHTQMILDMNRNEPLTWDELKTMEGKPVWMEYGIGFNQKRWVVIHSFHNTGSFCYMNVSGNYPNTFWQKDMGEDEFWQAYRKERHE